jgi:hypothetical protein
MNSLSTTNHLKIRYGLIFVFIAMIVIGYFGMWLTIPSKIDNAGEPRKIFLALLSEENTESSPITFENKNAQVIHLDISIQDKIDTIILEPYSIHQINMPRGKYRTMSVPSDKEMVTLCPHGCTFDPTVTSVTIDPEFGYCAVTYIYWRIQCK